MELMIGIILGLVAVLFWQTLVIEEKLNKILTELGLRKVKPIIKFIVKDNDNAIRGTKKKMSSYEHWFWDEYGYILNSDDPEDPYNEIVGILRDTAIKYFRDHDGGLI